jgi:benzoyl-CoA reductase subunit C
MGELQAGGLATAEKYYSDYGLRARELKASGRKVIGYVSSLCPVEIITAAGAVPIRLKGNVSEAITKADAFMETMICPFVRNVFDSALKGRYTFLDGMVMPHQCDSLERTNDVWNYNLGLSYWHMINFPHLADDPSVEFTAELLKDFAETLGDFTGHAVTNESLGAAIAAHNKNRAAMRALYELRKGKVPAITGAEMMKVLVAAMSLPVDESIALIESVIDEVKKRSAAAANDGRAAKDSRATKNGPRILLIGDQIDDVAIIDAIEGTGASLVMDDLSMGSKMYWGDVDATDDPYMALSVRYLRKLKMPMTFVGDSDNYQENLDARFGHLKKYIEEFKIEGAILFIYKFCDPYGFEVPATKSYIESAGAQVLYIEDEYSTSSLGRVKTRIEAFLEMIA